MSWKAVLAALEPGKMKPVGDNLSATEREAIEKSLGTAVLNPLPPSAKCSAAPQRASATGNWNGWADAANTRFQPARQAGLTRQTTPKLQLKWAFGFPGVTTAVGVASVVDGKGFLGAADGSVYSLDAATGNRIWRTYLVQEEAGATGQNKAGTKTWGPSGVAVWSSPTLDLQNKVIYAGTGVNYSNPPTNMSDAIVALEMDSGRILWSRQFTENDGWTFACIGQDKTNCPWDPVVDSDLGNSGILRPLGSGKRILIASDKGGTVYGIDPDREGAIVWNKKIARGGIFGGTMWGGASDDQGVAYIGISDFTAGKPEIGGGLIALQLATGKLLWLTKAPKPACAGVPGCSAAQPAPVTVIPGVAFLGSWDGHIRAYETKTGAIIWDFDTVQDFQTVNGVKARGGSINSMAPVIAGGMLYITSGYSGNAMPGNVLLAFSGDGK